MRVCNCTLPMIHGKDVCNKCQNNNDSQNEYPMGMIDIDKYTKIAEDCGFGIIPTKLEVKEKCEYCEVDVDDRKSLLVVETDFYNYEIYIDGNNNLTHYDMFEDNKINYCPMCGRKL